MPPFELRPENRRMRQFLLSHGIDCKPKYIHTGSLKGCWSLYNKHIKWSLDLANALNVIGFCDFNRAPLGQHSGNGGVFSVFVRGHNNLVTE